jgi:hypothetical protein
MDRTAYALTMAPPLLAPPIFDIKSEYEQKDKSDNEAEQAGRFRKREPKQQVRELAWSGGRVAKRALQEVSEDASDADASADKGRTGEACANELGCRWIHDNFLLFD